MHKRLHFGHPKSLLFRKNFKKFLTTKKAACSGVSL
nr:MAG TPA: DNA repair protein rad32, DNA double-strand break repair, Nuclease.2A [Caudoviricetes sp.]